MALLSTPAIVLGGIRLGEADKLITFFTSKRGKLKGVAKGARRIKSRFGASLEPFTHCNLIVFEKGTDKLSRINQTDIIHSFQTLREDWGGITFSSQMVEWVNQMVPEGEPNQAIFKLLLHGLTFLEEKTDPTLSMILFISHLIDCSGYQPRWDACRKCHLAFKAGIRQMLYFYPPSGGALCSKCARGIKATIEMTQGTRAFLNASQQMTYPLSHRLRPSTEMKKESEHIFKDYLSYLTGKPSPHFISRTAP